MKFVTDINLGKLAKWLRILGYDTIFFRGDISCAIPWAEKEGRLILTRRRKLLSSYKNLILIESDKLRAQVREVIEKLSLPLNPEKFFRRCVVCNKELFSVYKETIKDEVPLYVWETQEAFYRCPLCQRIFWSGTHKEQMEAFIRSHIHSPHP